MAHVAKFSRGAMGHMLDHYDRSKVGLGGNIDQKLTGCNYNITYKFQPLGQLEFIHQRLSEVKVQNRKDVNVLCDWIITLPKEFPSFDVKDFQYSEQDFFQKAYDFLAERYGEKNVVSAYVHMDEAMPHMHFAFIPIVTDKKKGIEKVSAKECITLNELKSFHKDLDEHMNKAFGRNICILNEATKEGNKSIEELKRGTATNLIREATAQAEQIVNTAKNEKKKIERENTTLKSQNLSLEKALSALENKEKILNARIIDLEGIFDDKEKSLTKSHEGKKSVLDVELRGLQNEIKDLHGKILTTKQVNEIEGKKNFMQDKYTITGNEYRSLKATSMKIDEILKREKKLDLRENTLNKLAEWIYQI